MPCWAELPQKRTPIVLVSSHALTIPRRRTRQSFISSPRIPGTRAYPGFAGIERLRLRVAVSGGSGFRAARDNLSTATFALLSFVMTARMLTPAQCAPRALSTAPLPAASRRRLFHDALPPKEQVATARHSKTMREHLKIHINREKQSVCFTSPKSALTSTLRHPCAPGMTLRHKHAPKRGERDNTVVIEGTSGDPESSTTELTLG